jgi:cell division protein FtsL
LEPLFNLKADMMQNNQKIQEKQTELSNNIISSKPMIKVVIITLTTIFLGALGSGLWDVFLRDIVIFLGNTLLKIIGFVYSGYLDDLHANIANGNIDRYSEFLYIMLIMVCCILPWFAIVHFQYTMRSEEEKLDEFMRSDNDITLEERIKKFKKKTDILKQKIKLLIRIEGVLAAFSTLIFISLATRDIYATNGAIYLDRSIEIVAPHISSTDVLQLRAAFRSIKTTADFHNLNLKLKQIAKDAKVELPRFNSIGSQ